VTQLGISATFDLPSCAAMTKRAQAVWRDHGPFFAIWQKARNAVCCCGALEAFVRGAPGNIRLANAGSPWRLGRTGCAAPDPGSRRGTV